MTAQPLSSRRSGRVYAGLAVAAMLASSACAAGQRAQTADQKPTLDGTETSVGQLDLRGISIAAPTSGPSYAAGSSAQLRLVVVNNGHNDDRLTSITASSLTGWGSYATSAQAAAVQSPSTAASSTSAAASSSSPAPSGSSSGGSLSRGSASNGSSTGASKPNSASSTRKRGSTSAAVSSRTPTRTTPTSTAAALPTPSRSIVIPTGGRTSWGVPDTDRTLLLTGLTQRLFPGNAVRLTFTFARAGRVSVDVPVALSTDPKNSFIPESSGK